MTLFSEFPRNGGLMPYGPNLLDIYGHVGGIAAKVLQGSKPADLPVEPPTKFELTALSEGHRPVDTLASLSEQSGASAQRTAT
jgi:hypothetical protein